ncbi:MAG: glycosyltransferase family 2 protein [Pseudomonadota bacterium]
MTQRVEKPLDISVAIICHNQERYIKQTIESVLEQSAQQVIGQIVIVDDCSTDGTAQAADSLAESDPRIEVVRRRTNSGGGAVPRNDAIARCRGTHIAFLDGDDLWLPDKLAHQLTALRQYPETGILFSDFIEFDDQTGQERLVRARRYTATDRHQLRAFFVHGGPILPSTAIVSRLAIETTGQFDPSLRFNEESEYWMRMLCAYPIHHQPVALIRKRKWFGSLGSSKFGLENIDCKREITRRMVSRVADLQAVEAQRTAQIELKTAVHYFDTGQAAQARPYLREALQQNAALHKARLFLALSYLSADPDRLLRLLRQARNMIPAVLR